METSTLTTLPLLFLFIISSEAMAAYNIVGFGAKPDGRTDASRPFFDAWAFACRSNTPATILVPAGVFYLSQALFEGPCRNSDIKIFIRGTIVAPYGYTQSARWLTFKSVEGLSIFGGTLNGRGHDFWDCKLSGRSCPIGAASLTIAQSKNVLIYGLTSINSELFHISVYESTAVTVHRVKISAPQNSPNTDGIHVEMSSGVTITGVTIETGDDCISMGPGSRNVWIERVLCGPGHGISIGSLGSTVNEAGVEDITAKLVTFTGTQNGLRIKTWGKPNRGYVKGVTFQHAFMRNVQNPIIIDQKYCEDGAECPNQSSGFEISEVSYYDIQGSSATEVAVSFECSGSNPCRSIRMQNVRLVYEGKPAKSLCENVQGTTYGIVTPPSCLHETG